MGSIRDSGEKPVLIGCDFGAPRRAADQAKKVVAIEALRVAQGHYVVLSSGRNERLVAWEAFRASAERDGLGRGGLGRGGLGRPRAGWTIPELAESLSSRPAAVAAFDFPFGIPLALLESKAFADALGRETPFESHAAWAAFVVSHLRLDFFERPKTQSGEPPVPAAAGSGEMLDLDNFQAWRQDSRFWLKRRTDRAARAQPPLKHIGQSMFAMTLAGACLLQRLQLRGVQRCTGTQRNGQVELSFETYPAEIARRVGFRGSYKQMPAECMRAALAYVRRRGIRCDVDSQVYSFCENYRTGGTVSRSGARNPSMASGDPDGADALLCLIAAICFDVGDFAVLDDGATPGELAEEGVIIVPRGGKAD